MHAHLRRLQRRQVVRLLQQQRHVLRRQVLLLRPRHVLRRQLLLLLLLLLRLR
jgi:hypothetical protein